MRPLTDTEFLELIRQDEHRACVRPPAGRPAFTEDERQRCNDLREVWVALGEWDVPEPATDLWPRVEKEVRRFGSRFDAAEYRRRAGESHREVWGSLEAWPLSAEDRDLWPRIAEAVRKEPRPRRAPSMRILWLAVGIAAALLVAIIVGRAAGLYVAARRRAVSPETAMTAAADYLRLDVLSSDTPAGLTDIVLRRDPGTGEETPR